MSRCVACSSSSFHTPADACLQEDTETHVGQARGLCLRSRASEGRSQRRPACSDGDRPVLAAGQPSVKESPRQTQAPSYRERAASCGFVPPARVSGVRLRGARRHAENKGLLLQG